MPPGERTLDEGVIVGMPAERSEAGWAARPPGSRPAMGCGGAAPGWVGERSEAGLATVAEWNL